MISSLSITSRREEILRVCIFDVKIEIAMLECVPTLFKAGQLERVSIDILVTALADRQQ
jgi:hypothetical protein